MEVVLSIDIMCSIVRVRVRNRYLGSGVWNQGISVSATWYTLGIASSSVINTWEDYPEVAREQPKGPI